MATKRFESRVRGCILGSVLGDAMGGPPEFQSVQAWAEKMGTDWIDYLSPSTRCHPLNYWRSGTPPGTGTDDTRNNWLFFRLGLELRRVPTAREAAGRFLQVGQDPIAFFPEHPEMEQIAKRQYGHRRNERDDSLPPEEAIRRSNTPGLSGLIRLAWAGLLCPGNPEGAYVAAYNADYVDQLYAKEAVAMLAACVSIAVVEDVEPLDLFRRVTDLDPFAGVGQSGINVGWFIRRNLLPLCEHFVDAESDRAAAKELVQLLIGYGPFDAFKTFGLPCAAMVATRGDAFRAMQIAINHPGLNVSGAPDEDIYQDIDCYGTVVGALGGAIAGVEAYPEEMVDNVIAANQEVYGIDLEATIQEYLAKFG